MGGCLISYGSGVLVRARRDPHGDDEGVYSIPSPARSRRHAILHDDPPVVPAPDPGSQEHHRPPGPAGYAPRLAHGPIPGRDRSAGWLPEPDGDMGAHHRPDRRRPGRPGTSGGTCPLVGVDHPAGAPGPGPHGPRHSCEVLVLYAYRHHREAQGGHGGR